MLNIFSEKPYQLRYRQSVTKRNTKKISCHKDVASATSKNMESNSCDNLCDRSVIRRLYGPVAENYITPHVTGQIQRIRLV